MRTISNQLTASNGLVQSLKRFLLPVAAVALLLGGCKKDNEAITDTSAPPVLNIVSPVEGATVAPGARLGTPTALDFNGSGFAINLEIVTKDTVTIPTRESLNIRNAAAVGQPNVNLPGFTASVDVDLIKPDGGTIPKGTNLASLFNVAGTDDTPGPGVTIWVSWHVLESVAANTSSFTLTTSVKDRAGRTATATRLLKVGAGPNGALSGEALTPAPKPITLGGADTPDGPTVTMIAPRTPSSVSPGLQAAGVLPAPPTSGALFFIQVSALDKSRNGLNVAENGAGAFGKTDAERGTIEDKTQSRAGVNRYVPGLNVTFDVPLLQPNGNVIPAGGNLAPVFNTAGSELDPSGFVRTTFGWSVGGTLQLGGKTSVTIKSSVTDAAGKTGSATQVVQISPIENGQLLTPAPR
ncbi:hypothetical protein [Hymenobacter profundi]|uniref:Uncharacterized protein n=1 Tax=Hymenobacter profundi TaxID=1982110 RepID=A0ABS6WU57_9BACT|nr:hypothetical protein [Hymenobacter profundi]MBW3127102.1 hypothetical protein [Hymenobacter profundi]